MIFWRERASGIMGFWMRIAVSIFLMMCLSAHAQKALWERPVIIGASLSDGFHLSDMGLPFASPRSKELGLHHHLKNELKVAHGPILNLGSNWTFIAAEPTGKRQIEKAREADPTVVFAIDYLFWYLSAEPRFRGRGYREMSRLEFFEVGLAHLATLKCPVVVGNIPDAKSSVGKVLSEESYAGTEMIAKANERLAEWIAERPNFALLDLHYFHKQVSTNQEVSVLDEVTPKGQTRDLFLQSDQLHPTLAGASMIAKVALDVLRRHVGP